MTRGSESGTASHWRKTARERRTAGLLAIGAVLLPLQIWPVMPLPGMQLSDVFFALALAHFLGFHFRAAPAAVSVPVAAFAVGVTVSALSGGSAVKLLGHFELAALAWMAACLSWDSARWLRRALVVAAMLAALTAMAGLAVFFAGIAGYDSAGIPENPLLYVHGSLVSGDYPRPRGTLVTGAMLTSVVATGVTLLWFEHKLVRGPWARRMIYAVCAIALIFAFSRTIATLGVVVIAVEVWRRDRPHWARGACAAAVAVYAIALAISLRYHVVLNPLEPWAIDVLAADGDRFAKWRDALVTLAENPVIGAGPGINVAAGWSAHNTWLNLWAGIGVVPLAAFAFLMFASLKRAFGARALGIATVLVFALAESTYMDIEDMRHLWLVIGIASGAGHAAGPRREG